MFSTINIAPVHNPPPATVGNVVDTGTNVTAGNLPPSAVSPSVSAQEANLNNKGRGGALEKALTETPQNTPSSPTPRGTSPSASSVALNQPSSAFITQLLAQTTLKGSLKDITYDFFTRGPSAFYPTLISFGDIKFMPNDHSSKLTDGAVVPADIEYANLTSNFEFPKRVIPETNDKSTQPIDILA